MTSTADLRGSIIESNILTCMQLLLGGALSVGGLYFYEHKLRPPAGSNSVYHELSMDTGF